DPKELEAHVRHLAKYVFPRQYGLSHPFVENERASFQSHKSLDYLDRESEIKRAGAQKTPKRVKAALHILDQMIWKHRKCRYKALLELVCPSKVRSSQNPFVLSPKRFRRSRQRTSRHSIAVLSL
ncbi:uncharacterized protein B0H18DRAFT_874847, partial [Fomitopsis serialis]|uniref:uncharacterized protein n=1 Tax=Fomitopsis serialis TaxID=139415 RepID=UPI002007EC33